jgi:hypothetical protein
MVQGHTTTVDTARVSTSEVKDYAMILLAGIGFEAEVCDAADREAKDALGPLAYIKAGEPLFGQGLSWRPCKAVLGIDSADVCSDWHWQFEASSMRVLCSCLACRILGVLAAKKCIK